MSPNALNAADECVPATLHLMPSGWAPEQLLDAVRSVVSSVEAGDGRVPAEVLLDGEDLLVTFSWPDQPQLFGIRVRPSESPEGPSTGEVCESAEEWAQEVAWVLMEELGTGLVHHGRRTVTTQGIVELHYRPDW